MHPPSTALFETQPRISHFFPEATLTANVTEPICSRDASAWCAADRLDPWRSKITTRGAMDGWEFEPLCHRESTGAMGSTQAFAEFSWSVSRNFNRKEGMMIRWFQCRNLGVQLKMLETHHLLTYQPKVIRWLSLSQVCIGMHQQWITNQPLDE